MGDIIDMPVLSRVNSDPDRVLSNAEGKLEHVIIVGYKKDGSEYFKSSVADGGDALWILERARHKLMLIADDA